MKEGWLSKLANMPENRVVISAAAMRIVPDGHRGGAAPISKLSKMQDQPFMSRKLCNGRNGSGVSHCGIGPSIGG